MRLPDANKVGDNIRLRREMAGLSQNELARDISVTAQTIYRWEKGERLPGTEDLVRLCTAFGVSIETLLWGVETEMPLPLTLVQFFRSEEGKRLTDAQRVGLARLLDGYEIDEATLKSALFLLHRQPVQKAG